MPPYVFSHREQLAGSFKKRGGVQSAGLPEQHLAGAKSFGQAAKYFGIDPEARVGPLDPLQEAILNERLAA